MQLDVDAHGRVTPRDDATRRALADRAGRFLLLPSASDLLLGRRDPPLGAAAARPRCVLAGDLSGFPIVDFVAFVHQSRVTGVLTVASEGVERSITFKDGEVRSADSSASGERLGEVAVRLGFATEAQLAAVRSSGQPIGRALVAGGVVSANDLWKCVHEQVGEVFHAILLAGEGVFFLVDEEVAERAGPALAVNTQSLLMDGIRRIDEMSLFRARIPGPGAALRRREPRRPVPLNAAEQQLLALVDGRRTVAELAAAAHLGEFDATKTLYHLAEAGYVEASGDVRGGATAGGRLERLVAALNELLQLVAASVPGRHQPAFHEAVRGFLAEPSALHAPLWHGLTPAGDGSLDAAALLERLASLPAPVLQRLEPTGDRGALALEALRELLYFYLFTLGGLLPHAEDDALAAEVKHRLATLGGAAE
ncbi:MAG TPA: DUF4388 domain-containing protein [Anaeromyxobacteraceae bacterium]|nr:DUF4388 domain-containing protein [Anaeromyxobacteraceae bacterium]